MVEIEVSGFRGLQASIVKLAEEAYPAAVKTLQDLGEIMAHDARSLAPVKTGALRDSIRSERQADGADVVAGGGSVGYAAHQEWGTSKISGRGFMSRAAAEALDALDQMYEQELGRR